MRKSTIQFSKQTDRDLEHLTKAPGGNPKADFIQKAGNLLRFVLRERRGEGGIVVETYRAKRKKEPLPI